jgi:hypothetical protein
MTQTATDPKPPTKRETARLAKLRDEARTLRESGVSLAELRKRFGADWDTDWLEGIAAPTSGKRTSANGKPKAAKPKAATGPTGKRLPITNDAVRMIRAKFGKVPAEQLAADVKAMCGATASVEQVDKIGKRIIRDDVPDVPRKAAAKK